MPVFNNILAGAAGQSSGDYAIQRSLRFNSGDSADLSKTFSNTGNRRTWTFSAWIKFCAPAGTSGIFECPYPGSGGTISNTFEVWYEQGRIHITDYGTYYFTSVAYLRDPSAWGHLVIRVDTTEATALNRIRLYWNGEQLVNTASGTVSQNADLAVNTAALHKIGNWRNTTYSNLYFAEIHHVDGQSLDPTSFGEFSDDTGAWNPKRYSDSHGTNGFHLNFSDNSSNAALGTDSSGNNNTWTVNNHSISDIIYAGNAYDGNLNQYMPSGVTQATDPNQLASTSNRTHFFLVNQGNSVNLTVVATATSMTVGSSVYDGWGSNNPTTTLDNGTVTPNSSGTDTSVSGKNLATNTFTGLTIGNTYTISTKNGGAGNPHRVHYVTGATVQSTPVVSTDSVLDSPTNYEAESGNNSGNYATLNPLIYGDSVTYSKGNLRQYSTSSSWSTTTRATTTIGLSSGKWYWEQTHSTHQYSYTGIVSADYWHSSYPGYDSQSCGFQTSNGAGYQGGGANIQTSGGSPHGAISANDTLMFALDLDNQKMWIGRNGTWLNANDTGQAGNPATGANSHFTNLIPGRTYYPACSTYGTVTVDWNLGAGGFSYAPPTGYKSICTQNLADPTIANGSDYFDSVIYNGSGYSDLTNPSQSITGLSFSPSFVWAKARSAAYSHGLFDVLRGPNKQLRSNGTNVETNDSGNTSSLVSFDSNGFTLGPDGGAGSINYGSTSYVAWNWRASSSSTSISAGSLNSSAYNQSQNWYTAGTESGSWSGAYDWQGVFESSDTSTTNGSESMATSGTTKFTFGTAVAASSNVTILSYQNVTATFKVNAGETDETSLAVSANTAVSEHVITFNGDVKNIQIESSGQFTYVTGVKIDGKLLVNPGGTLANVPGTATTCRANQTSGFSIVSYVGSGANTSIGHNLNAVPEFAIFKARDGGSHWLVYHKSLGNTKPLHLNLADSAGSAHAQYFQNANPTSSVFYLGGSAPGNWSGYNMIGYLFSGVEGYSSFGSYEGNSSSGNGTFVPLTFAPAFILVKSIDTSQYWYLADKSRSPVNDNATEGLWANENVSEFSYNVDLLSNGFKHRNTSANLNSSNTTFVYAAFSSHPFKYARSK